MLGFSIGVLAILVTQAESNALSASLPLLLLGLPILDTVTVMVRRTIAGESPFVGDRKHLHHRLLGIGFAHREAVMVVYCIQVGLFLLAYFLRFQSDALILLVYGAFAAILLGALHWAVSSGWQAHPWPALGFAGRWMARSGYPAMRYAVVQGASWTMCAGLIAYGAIVIIAAHHVGGDISLLSGVMLVLLFALSRFAAAGALGWFERLAAYLSVILIVYLDQTTTAHDVFLAGLIWTVIGVTAVAALLRFAFSERRLEVTALDMLVVFVALVVPNLPGFLSLPAGLPAGILKAVVLLYVVEMVEGLEVRRSVPRALAAVMLGAIVLRGLPLLLAS
jgi:UDP-GlcNAc:undecaprenyl-phosphate/decaprenyl-phosphate GlcNAc-1-phosphate transferase